MPLQPIDVPSLLSAVVWPVIVIFGLIFFRHPVTELVTIIGQRVQKFSFSGFSLELAEAKEMRSPILDTEIRQLDAGLIVQSGSTAISQLLLRLQENHQHDYVMIDLGSESSPRWLTSRLYLLTFLITVIDRPISMVFVENTAGVRKRFIGISAAERVRWALARRYGWLESAAAVAWAVLGGLYCDPVTSQPTVTGISSPFDPATQKLAESQTTQFIQSFLNSIRAAGPAPLSTTPEANDWIPLNDQTIEHAKWLNSDRIERLLGPELTNSSVVLMPNQSVNEAGPLIVKQRGRFVAVLDTDRSFRCLVDRFTALDSVAKQFLKAEAKP